MTDLGEFTVQQPGGDLSDAGRAVALETDQSIAGTGAGKAEGDHLAGGHRLRGLTEHPGRHQGGTVGAGAARAPRQFLQRHPIAVGGQQRKGVAVDLHPDAGEHREQLVAAGGHHDLGDGTGEILAGHGSGGFRHRRQCGVVVHGKGLQGEPGAAADQFHAGRVGGDVHRLVRQGSGDVGQQPTRHQRDAVVGDVRLHRDLSRGLVVEAGHHDLAVGRLDQEPGEDRDAGPGGQASGRPGHGFGQDIAIETDLHGAPLLSSPEDDHIRSPCPRTSVHTFGSGWL